jgi:hypothetical protein
MLGATATPPSLRLLYRFSKSRDSSVGIATDYGLDDSMAVTLKTDEASQSHFTYEAAPSYI